MIVRDILSEDFVNYKVPSMFISVGTCNWKCCIEQNIDISICQNSKLAQTPEQEISNLEIINMYLLNPISKAVVIGGLEPFSCSDNIFQFISEFRQKCNNDIVIYTGYYPYEIIDELMYLSQFDNIIIKFGRFIPNEERHLDKILGVELASNNQYAVKLNKGSKKIIQAMGDNNGYCPCKITKNESTLCSCLEFREQKSGNCSCGIFSK